MDTEQPKNVADVFIETPRGTEIVAHDTIPISSVVMSCFATSIVVDLAPFYYCTKVSLKNEYAEGEGMSVRWKNYVKGRPGGCFNSQSAMVDICIGGTHRHGKVWRNSNIVSMTGVKSKAEGTVVFRYILAQVHDAQAYLTSTKSGSWSAAMEWLISHTRGEELHPTHNATITNKEYGTILICKDTTEHRLVWPTTYPIRYAAIIKEFLERSDDLINSRFPIYHRYLVERIECIRSATHIYEGDFAFATVKLTSLIYYYNLGFCPDRQKLNAFLLSQGYNSDFTPIWGKTVKVIVDKGEMLDPNLYQRDDMSNKQKLTFYQRGSIKHNGPVKEEMAEDFAKIIKLIRDNRTLFAL